MDKHKLLDEVRAHFDALRAFYYGDSESGRRVIDHVGKLHSNGERSRSWAVRRYFDRFCQRVAEGATLTQALGAKKSRHGARDPDRDRQIAEQVDTEWLLSNVTQRMAAKSIAEKTPGMGTNAVEKIFKRYRVEFDQEHHDEKILQRVEQLVEHQSMAVNTAFQKIGDCLNTRPECRYSDFAELKRLYADRTRPNPFLAKLEARARQKPPA